MKLKTNECVGIFILFVSVALTACGGGGGGGGTTQTATDTASAVVDASGGTVRVLGSSTIAGAKIVIPAGALDLSTTISIGPAINAPGFRPVVGDVNTSITIGPAGTKFQIPATITLPFSAAQRDTALAVFMAESTDESWQYLPDALIDSGLGIAQVQISHLSHFKVASIPPYPGGGDIKYYLHPEGLNGLPETGDISKSIDTMREVINTGPIKTLSDRICVTFSETNIVRNADLIVLWRDVPVSPVNKRRRPAFWTTSADNDLIILNDNADPSYSVGPFHYESTTAPADRLDFYSIFAHELSHVLGIPSQRDPAYPENGLFDDSIGPGDMVRVLVDDDLNLFESVYPPVYYLSKMPIGDISESPASIRVEIYANCSFDGGRISMSVDGVEIPSTSIETLVAPSGDGHITANLSTDLSMGIHSVQVSYTLDSGAELKSNWQFTIKDPRVIGKPWVGNWIQVNFLGDDGIWGPDDPSGIGFVANITEDEWVEIDEFGEGCIVTYSFSVDADNRYSKIATNVSNTCPFPLGSFLNESGRLDFSEGNNSMIEYFDVFPGDTLEAFKWTRQ